MSSINHIKSTITLWMKTYQKMILCNSCTTFILIRYFLVEECTDAFKQVEMSQDNVVSLFRLGAKYMCTELKDRSEEYIKGHLNQDNVVSILILAYNNAAPKLKKECLSLMLKKKQKLKQT